MARPARAVEVAGRRDQAPRCRAKRALQHLAIVERTKADRHIRMAVDEVHGPVRHVESDFDLGVKRVELTKPRCNHMQREAHRRVYTQRAARRAPSRRKVGERLGPGDDVLRRDEQVASLGGQFDGAGAAAQECDAKLRF